MNIKHRKIKIEPSIKLNYNIYMYKGKRFKEKAILDIKTHFKPTETLHISLRHLVSVKIGFMKGEALRLLRTNSFKSYF